MTYDNFKSTLQNAKVIANKIVNTTGCTYSAAYRTIYGALGLLEHYEWAKANGLKSSYLSYALPRVEMLYTIVISQPSLAAIASYMP